MPLQNRVTPLGDLIATPERGLVYGNRGCLHDEQGQIRRQWQVKRWISCRLEFRGRHRTAGPMPPGRYTGLFFLDDATALAAGHRPCAECRREAYNLFTSTWGAKADAIDEVLHRERLQRFHPARLEDLPDGAFVLEEDEPFLVVGDELLRWTPGGYTQRRARRRGKATLITPPSTVRVLQAGWESDLPLIHSSSRSRG
jgi:methylphosphotriester-DNA--protein-cysteine methyltransferase